MGSWEARGGEVLKGSLEAGGTGLRSRELTGYQEGQPEPGPLGWGPALLASAPGSFAGGGDGGGGGCPTQQPPGGPRHERISVHTPAQPRDHRKRRKLRAHREHRADASESHGCPPGQL